MKRKVYILSDDMAQQIEDFRFKERFPSEADAVRYLLAKGLDTCVNLPQPDENAEEKQNVE
jgi:Arc/MetJ-type ribon-helix-helix transcriptional regulator